MATNTCVVIPNWNGKRFIGDCLESLRSQVLGHDVIVVDNGSTDGSPDFIEKHYPNVTLIKLDKNYGFAGGVNRGVTLAVQKGYTYIALLNNDAVVDKNWLQALQSSLTSSAQIGIAASKMLLKNGQTIDSTGELYSIWGTPFPRGRGHVDNGQYDNERNILGASGGASLYRAALFKDVGLFDERFFAYYEDIDLSIRARLRGWQVRYAPKAVVYHTTSATSAKLPGFSHYHQLKNFFFLYLKNMPGILFWKYLPFALAGWLGRNAVHFAKGRFGVLLRAWGAVLLNVPGMLASRWQIQRQRTVTPADLDRMLWHQLAPSQRARLGLRKK